MVSINLSSIDKKIIEEAKKSERYRFIWNQRNTSPIERFAQYIPYLKNQKTKSFCGFERASAELRAVVQALIAVSEAAKKYKKEMSALDSAEASGGATVDPGSSEKLKKLEEEAAKAEQKLLLAVMKLELKANPLEKGSTNPKAAMEELPKHEKWLSKNMLMAILAGDRRAFKKAFAKFEAMQEIAHPGQYARGLGNADATYEALRNNAKLSLRPAEAKLLSSSASQGDKSPRAFDFNFYIEATCDAVFSCLDQQNRVLSLDDSRLNEVCSKRQQELAKGQMSDAQKQQLMQRERCDDIAAMLSEEQKLAAEDARFQAYYAKIVELGGSCLSEEQQNLAEERTRKTCLASLPVLLIGKPGINKKLKSVVGKGFDEIKEVIEECFPNMYKMEHARQLEKLVSENKQHSEGLDNQIEAAGMKAYYAKLLEFMGGEFTAQQQEQVIASCSVEMLELIASQTELAQQMVQQEQRMRQDYFVARAVKEAKNTSERSIAQIKSKIKLLKNEHNKAVLAETKKSRNILVYAAYYVGSSFITFKGFDCREIRKELEAAKASIGAIKRSSGYIYGFYYTPELKKALETVFDNKQAEYLSIGHRGKEYSNMIAAVRCKDTKTAKEWRENLYAAAKGVVVSWFDAAKLRALGVWASVKQSCASAKGWVLSSFRRKSVKVESGSKPESAWSFLKCSGLQSYFSYSEEKPGVCSTHAPGK